MLKVLGCEFCEHSVIDNKRYHGTMLSCNRGKPFKWDNRRLMYVPSTEDGSCDSYHESDID